MDFSEALYGLKYGDRARRAGWNGKGMWLQLVKHASQFAALNPVRARERTHWHTLTSVSDTVDVTFVHMEPFIMMRTADGKFIPWLASQTDLLADDWEDLT